MSRNHNRREERVTATTAVTLLIGRALLRRCPVTNNKNPEVRGMDTIQLYDTTLRDGAQAESLSLSLNDKLRIARRLDRFGVQYIEGGWPGSNPKDAQFFERAAAMTFQNARISAFGSTRRKHSRCEDDANLSALVAAKTPVVALVAKSWDLHVHEVLETSLEENLAMIDDSVRYLKAHGKEVVLDAEHFADAFVADREYALRVAEVAAAAGADWLVLCDTNGGALPWQVAAMTSETAARVRVPLGVHAHNDSGCAVANSLAAVHAGCTMVQGTVNGYGERVGNADLTTVAANLQLKMGRPCVHPEQLADLTRLSRWLAEVANLEHGSRHPYTGRSAFAHKGGIHVAAMQKSSASYQHVDPHLVGNEPRYLVSELSGRGNLAHVAQSCGLQANQEAMVAVLGSIKELESRGYSFEGAEATVGLMLRRAEPGYRPPFRLLESMVVAGWHEARGADAEATVKVRVGDDVLHTAAVGNGPVDAFANALRRALAGSFPTIEQLQLTDYKVRIVDGDEGTAATIRVLVSFRHGERRWSTVGASTNIIEASSVALSDSFELAVVESENAENKNFPVNLDFAVDKASSFNDNPSP